MTRGNEKEREDMHGNVLHTCYIRTFLLSSGKEKLNYPPDTKVYVVLEEDGTEVDEEEYFQTLPGKDERSIDRSMMAISYKFGGRGREESRTSIRSP